MSDKDKKFSSNKGPKNSNLDPTTPPNNTTNMNNMNNTTNSQNSKGDDRTSKDCK